MRTKTCAALLLATLAWPAAAQEPVTGTATMRDAVTLAIDGARYRLEGIAPPAEGAVCGPQQCLDAAMDELARFVAGQKVTCTKAARVGHGFFLSSCRLETGADVAEHMLSEGLAEPDADADTALREAAEQARLAKRGLWAAS